MKDECPNIGLQLWGALKEHHRDNINGTATNIIMSGPPNLFPQQNLLKRPVKTERERSTMISPVVR